jgi:hypothetical protein
LFSESCAVFREENGEALTGVRAGRLFNREIAMYRRSRRAWVGAEGNSTPGVMRARCTPLAVVDPAHARTHHARKPGGVVLASVSREYRGREGKPKGVIPR